MLSNIRLYQIHCRLYEICYPFKRFISVTTSLIRKFLQHFTMIYRIGATHGKKSKFFELTEVMRQQGDTTFIDLLNNVSAKIVSEVDIVLIS